MDKAGRVLELNTIDTHETDKYMPETIDTTLNQKSDPRYGWYGIYYRK